MKEIHDAHVFYVPKVHARDTMPQKAPLERTMSGNNAWSGEQSDGEGREEGAAQDPSFVLVRPQLAENVGTSLRALWNCGFGDLRLVEPRDAWPSEKGVKAAAGAADQAGSVRTFSTLHEALNDANLTVTLTVRERDMIKPLYAPEDIATLLQQHKKVAFVFGPERTGLSSDEVSRTQGILTLPMNPAYGSLNLAQAVLLVAYLCRSALRTYHEAPIPLPPSASSKTLIDAADHLERLLVASGFFHPPALQARMARNLRNMMMRLPYTEQEIRSLRGVIRHFQHLYEKTGPFKKEDRKDI
jgi:tRNA/rRNA methyltransferase